MIAHDGKKADADEYIRNGCVRDVQPGKLKDYHLVATETTGKLLRDKVGLQVESMLAGPLGGDAQIAARVAEGRVAGVIFFVDPLNAHPRDSDIQGLLRVCNVHNVPLATNVATADLIVSGQAI